MPPIEVGPVGAVSAINARLARKAGGEASSSGDSVAATARQSAPVVEKSVSFDLRSAPVDTDRVNLIRKAIESGHYPVVPTKIADAIIAAGVLLRSGK